MATFLFHYRRHPIKPENQVRLHAEPLIWPKNGTFCPHPLMFWACPVGTLGFRGSEREGNLAASLKAARGRQIPPSSYFRSVVVKIFEVFPKMFVIYS